MHIQRFGEKAVWTRLIARKKPTRHADSKTGLAEIGRVIDK